MKLKFMATQYTSMILILSAISIHQPAIANTQNTNSIDVSNQANSSNIFVENTGNQINEFIGDVKNFVQQDLLSPINNLINSAIGALQIPDIAKLWNQILGGSASNSPGAILSEILENKTNGQSSYGIRQDIGKDTTRNIVTEIANQATLGETAQTQITQREQATRQDTQAIINLGEESQSLDVSQQILQNLSQQTALNSKVNERILQEAQQARFDRALNNTLIAQTAKELAAINTADRRKTIAAGNAMSQQAGLLMMPGGITLGENN
ncbi:hypothetical protein B6N60_04886 [Richelia sinica FACHB-800]|uniref:Uncharacterized protein n=1 Tax=Richelia sinica FACHB-800 TaxID=1357546 RepID=A0A975TCC5_9NOST|nr:hypothetical protein [Richelia sinica]MBD2666216.1 hypothetical protein [Richelia sinica FACHB-800]QXE26155.1 hypothetical protein B6N60_04886 [Richelia sinica FACHB-800]